MQEPTFACLRETSENIWGLPFPSCFLSTLIMGPEVRWLPSLSRICPCPRGWGHEDAWVKGGHLYKGIYSVPSPKTQRLLQAGAPHMSMKGRGSLWPKWARNMWPGILRRGKGTTFSSGGFISLESRLLCFHCLDSGIKHNVCKRHLHTGLKTWFGCLDPTWWLERTQPRELPYNLTLCTVGHISVSVHTHTKKKTCFR